MSTDRRRRRNRNDHDDKQTFREKYGGTLALIVAGILILVAGLIAGDIAFNSGKDKKNTIITNNVIQEPVETPDTEEPLGEEPLDEEPEVEEPIEEAPEEDPLENPDEEEPTENRITVDAPKVVFIDFKVIEENDSTLEKGKKVVTRIGVQGEKRINYVVSYLDGKEVERIIKSEEVIKQPVNQLVKVGTKEPAPTPIITTKQETVVQEVAFETIFEDDDAAYIGSTETAQDGIKGVKTITYELTLKDGVETSRKTLSSVITKEPVNKIVKTGTKPLEEEPASATP